MAELKHNPDRTRHPQPGSLEGEAYFQKASEHLRPHAEGVRLSEAAVARQEIGSVYAKPEINYSAEAAAYIGLISTKICDVRSGESKKGDFTRAA